MDAEDRTMWELMYDLAEFMAERSRITTLPMDQVAKALLECDQRFLDLPSRVQNAMLYSNCVLIEQEAACQRRCLLQHGDLIICDPLPGYMRDAILKPILSHLTPLDGDGETIWCCMT